MAITERDVETAAARAEALRRAGRAVAVRLNRRRMRIVVSLNTGIELTVPVRLVEHLANASPEDLADIEISPSGLGLHWPKLDADVYVPALMEGEFGTRQWMAARLGAEGGRARSPAKVAAARENGRKGGRPRRTTGG